MSCNSINQLFLAIFCIHSSMLPSQQHGSCHLWVTPFLGPNWSGLNIALILLPWYISHSYRCVHVCMFVVDLVVAMRIIILKGCCLCEQNMNTRQGKGDRCAVLWPYNYYVCLECALDFFCNRKYSTPICPQYTIYQWWRYCWCCCFRTGLPISNNNNANNKKETIIIITEGLLQYHVLLTAFRVCA